jgi:hypothetical protein
MQFKIIFCFGFFVVDHGGIIIRVDVPISLIGILQIHFWEV